MSLEEAVSLMGYDTTLLYKCHFVMLVKSLVLSNQPRHGTVSSPADYAFATFVAKRTLLPNPSSSDGLPRSRYASCPSRLEEGAGDGCVCHILRMSSAS